MTIVTAFFASEHKYCKHMLAFDDKAAYAINKKGATYYGKFFNSVPH